MILAQVFEDFVEASPVSLMVRGILEAVLSPQKLDELFKKTSPTQYSRELLFSALLNSSQDLRKTHSDRRTLKLLNEI